MKMIKEIPRDYMKCPTDYPEKTKDTDKERFRRLLENQDTV